MASTITVSYFSRHIQLAFVEGSPMKSNMPAIMAEAAIFDASVSTATGISPFTMPSDASVFIYNAVFSFTMPSDASVFIYNAVFSFTMPSDASNSTE